MSALQEMLKNWNMLLHEAEGLEEDEEKSLFDLKKRADAEFAALRDVVGAARVISDNRQNFGEYDLDGMKEAFLNILGKALARLDALQ